MALDTPRFHRETHPWIFGSCPPPREAKLYGVRLEKHELRSACKWKGVRGGGRYFQKVVSAAVADERATRLVDKRERGGERERKKVLVYMAGREFFFCGAVNGTCGENVVAAVWAVQIYYSVTLRVSPPVSLIKVGTLALLFGWWIPLCATFYLKCDSLRSYSLKSSCR